MFYQNALIIRENDQNANDDSLHKQLVNIGYHPSQLVTVVASAYLQEDPINYEIILFVTEDMGQAHPFILNLSTTLPDHPLIIITDTALTDSIPPPGADDWLLKAWLEPLLLKKTINQTIERKKNSCNYSRIFRENPSPMYIYDKETFQFLEVNTSALKQYGYDRKEFLQLTARDIRPIEELEAFYKINDELPASYSNAGIWHHTRKDGETFYVHIYTHQILFGGKRCKLVTAVNIDGSVKAEKVLKEKARETENILESITDGFFTLNKSWEFTYINKEFERILSRNREDLLGKNIWEIFTESLKLDFFAQYHKAMDEHVSVHFEEFDHTISRWLAVNAYPTESGLAIYFVDITDQKNYQQKIERQNKQFKEIAWVQAHQIRGPVSNLLGLVDLFNIKQPSDPDNLELLARVRHTAIQMDESIKDIVYLTRKLESENM
ncbi:PAS domain S-box-containing protein [Pedobacter sp. ok626]|uniref:PAS domain-containing protein n=1 Tax=Pedobacter sp. ok626 TaxID=1761882 RepID=UPI000886851A|nr:PAS domain S-box protein [Pedobacter sp. ok626]SDL11933.1 PAS domain S-box-containing protein [Pedobacter sp. ok626]